jgi:hypothetical protein
MKQSEFSISVCNNSKSLEKRLIAYSFLDGEYIPRNSDIDFSIFNYRTRYLIVIYWITKGYWFEIKKAYSIIKETETGKTTEKVYFYLKEYVWSKIEQCVMWRKNGVFTFSDIGNRFTNNCPLFHEEQFNIKIYELGPTWEIERVLWLGHKKGKKAGCLLSILPKELFKEILYYVSLPSNPKLVQKNLKRKTEQQGCI